MKKSEYPEIIYKATEKTIRRMKKYQWKYRNLILLITSFVVGYYILRSPQVEYFIHLLGNFGYLASFVAGIFFTYGLTAVPATAILFTLGQDLNPFLIAFTGAIGSVISNYFLFIFIRDRLLVEINSLLKEVKSLTKPVSFLFFWKELRIRIWQAISKSKIWQLITPVIGGFIIASPLPNELAAAMFAAVKFEPKKFIIVTYLLSFIGILAIASSAKLLI
ncbi:MAG: hypothetical protein QW818_02685 [Candidatus Aenigmatarchaeota archaeon]